MSKTKIELAYMGVHNEDLLHKIEEINPLFAEEIKPYIDNDKEFFGRIWDMYDLAFAINDEQSQISQDIYSSDDYKKGSTFYNFVLEKIINEFHAYNKNGHNLKNSRVWG